MYLSDITFEEWIRYVFDHPVTNPIWYHEMDTDWWNENESPAITVAFMTKLFEDAGELLRPYSDAQLAQAFEFLINPGLSWHLGLLTDPKIDITVRLHCIKLIYNLFEQIFAPRYNLHISKGIVSIPPAYDKNPLNDICFMWWDTSPIYGLNETDDQRQISNAAFDVMKRILQLDSLPCQESALHGLGHADLHYLAARKAIDEWLLTHQDTISDRLKNYALAARDGNVQ